jgi:hopene-associated glycosyltransferase HpnB
VIGILLAALTLAIWLYLLLGRGFFWRGAERDDAVEPGAAATTAWPSVTAIIPARNEAEVVEASLGSLLRQTYPGLLSVILVDDQSTDGTGDIARKTADRYGAAHRVTILRGSEPPHGWTGKLWAMQRGILHLDSARERKDFVLFTDADIAYQAPAAVERLVRRSLARGAVLTSLMVKLRCDSPAERLLVPAFIFFFAKLFPFSWVNDHRRPTAAAAGGCMLVRRDALAAAGGLETIRSALIDDCALGAALKRQGPVWLGLTRDVVSLRPYPAFNDIRRMVVRSAFAQLRYSTPQLIGAVTGMVVTYLLPPFLTIFANGPARILGAFAWAAMALAFLPTLRFYGRSPAWGLALPLIAAIYTGFTVESAVQHWRGRGGAWKGRFQAARHAAGGIAPDAIGKT